MKGLTRKMFGHVLLRLSIPLFALGIATGTSAYEVEQIEDAYELSLDSVSFPASVAGSITFRSCTDCSLISMRLNSATRYRVNGTETTMPDFLTTVARIRESRTDIENSDVAVFFNLQTGQLTRIELFLL